jgi:hypothetical protein
MVTNDQKRRSWEDPCPGFNIRRVRTPPLARETDEYLGRKKKELIP